MSILKNPPILFETAYGYFIHGQPYHYGFTNKYDNCLTIDSSRFHSEDLSNSLWLNGQYVCSYLDSTHCIPFNTYSSIIENDDFLYKVVISRKHLRFSIYKMSRFLHVIYNEVKCELNSSHTKLYSVNIIGQDEQYIYLSITTATQGSEFRTHLAFLPKNADGSIDINKYIVNGAYIDQCKFIKVIDEDFSNVYALVSKGKYGQYFLYGFNKFESNDVQLPATTLQKLTPLFTVHNTADISIDVTNVPVYMDDRGFHCFTLYIDEQCNFYIKHSTILTRESELGSVLQTNDLSISNCNINDIFENQIKSISEKKASVQFTLTIDKIDDSIFLNIISTLKHKTSITSDNPCCIHTFQILNVHTLQYTGSVQLNSNSQYPIIKNENILISVINGIDYYGFNRVNKKYELYKNYNSDAINVIGTDRQNNVFVLLYNKTVKVLPDFNPIHISAEIIGEKYICFDECKESIVRVSSYYFDGTPFKCKIALNMNDKALFLNNSNSIEIDITDDNYIVDIPIKIIEEGCIHINPMVVV